MAITSDDSCSFDEQDEGKKRKRRGGRSKLIAMVTFSVQHLWYVQMLFGNVEGIVEIFDWIVLGQLVVVDEIRTMTMDESAKGETVFEAHVKVLHVYVFVRLCLALTPEQEALLGGHFYRRT